MEAIHAKVAAVRPLAYFPPDIWGDNFVTFTPEDVLEMENYKTQIEPLKKEVQMMIVDKSIDLEKKMVLIDAVERLGISYHYENEIEEQLDYLFAQLSEKCFDMEYDLSNTALQFRVFRQHGHKMPCDVFKKFTENDSNMLKETTRNDIKGMVSLYEAVHLRVHGESVLEEALAFTTDVLETSGTESEQARHALKQAVHFGVHRVETRHFISLYHKVESRNDTLLSLARVDCNWMQLLHRQELSQILKWWHDLDFKNKLPYARQRCVECHFWSIAMYYEPQYSLARILLVKVLLVISILDDTYDAYGTYEELRLLTEAFERWDLSATEDFPEDYMKLVFKFVYNIYEDFDKEMTQLEKPYAAQFAKDRVKDLVRCYFIEAKWYNEKYVPTFEEYMENARITGVGQIIVTSSLLGMHEIVEMKPFEQIAEAPKAIRACEDIGRIMDDIVSHQEEQARGHGASGVECYMKDHDMSRKEVVHILNKMVEDAWKDLNEEFMDNSKFANEEGLPKPILKRALNLARVLDAFYNVIDGYTYSAKIIKNEIIATFVKPIPL